MDNKAPCFRTFVQLGVFTEHIEAVRDTAGAGHIRIHETGSEKYKSYYKSGVDD